MCAAAGITLQLQPMAARKPPARTGPIRRARPARPALREQLKAVSKELAAARKKKRPPATPARSQEGPSFDELAAGVKRLPRGVLRAAAAPLPAPPAPSAAPLSRLYVEQREGAVRARAAGVPARWLDALEGGRVVPRRELDLHRKSASEARHAIAAAVRETRRAGLGCLLIVCGRGKHSSKGEPVLPDVAIECLSEALAGEVLAFTSAPRKWGGRGALIVRVRPSDDG
jgi:DNA-nicking Smr family endonuclease